MISLQKIEKDGILLAIVYRKEADSEEELNFLTPEYFPLQVGIHNKQKSATVLAHKHKKYENLLEIATQEIFYIDSGKVKVSVYDKDDKLFQSIILGPGDLMISNSGHALEFLEKTRMIEVKQGPYRGKSEEKEFIGEK